MLQLPTGGLAVWWRIGNGNDRVDGFRRVSQLHDAQPRDPGQGSVRQYVVHVRCHFHLEFDLQEGVLGVLGAIAQDDS